MQILKLVKAKKGAFGGNISPAMIERMFLVFVLVTVLFQAVADLFPTLVNAGNNLSASGIPLGQFFQSGGVVYLLIAAGLVIMIVNTFMTSKKR